MHASTPSSLDSAALSRRLGELAGHERAVQVEFLLHLSEFDSRRAWAEEGYASLWDYLLRVLHLREGAAFRRIAAMRVVRRLPVVAEALRDGRLCLTTVSMLAPLLSEANIGELVARAAFLTKAELERLVVTLQPRTAPKDGLRLLPSKKAQPRETRTPVVDEASNPMVSVVAAPPAAAAALQLAHPPSRATLEPVTADTYSLRVTVDAALEKDLEELKALLSHKIPKGDLTAVVREAVQCALEKHRKRKGAAEPSSRMRKSPVAAKDVKKLASGREPISAAVRREVWKRDEGRCTWRGPDGKRCGSTWKAELDHIRPAALGGPSTVENLRILCRAHNTLSAEHAFGRAHMEACRNKATRTSEGTSPGGSGSAEPGASEPAPSLPVRVQRQLRL